MNKLRSWITVLWILNWSKPTAFLSQEFLYKKPPLFVTYLIEDRKSSPRAKTSATHTTQTNFPGPHCYDQQSLQFRLLQTHWAAEGMKGSLCLWRMSKKPKMAARLCGTGQAPEQTLLCLPSDYSLEVESTRAATTIITVSKTINKDPHLQTMYLKNSVTWTSPHKKWMG